MANAFDTAVIAYTNNSTNGGLYWALEDSNGTSPVADSSAYGQSSPATPHTGTVVSGVTLGTAGIVPSDSATCATFTSGSITNAYKPVLGAGTMGGIVQFSVIPTSIQNIFNGGSATGDAQLGAGTTGQARFALSSSNVVSSNLAMTVNHTYLIIGTWDGTTQTIYQVDLTAKSYRVTAAAVSATLNEVASMSVGGTTLTGLLARFFILPSALTLTQVLALTSTALGGSGSAFFGLL